MKKNILKTGIILALVAILSITLNFTFVKENIFSDVLTRIEALAEPEGGSGGSGGSVTIRPGEIRVFDNCVNPFWTKGCDPKLGGKCQISNTGSCSMDLSTVLSALGLIVTILSMC